MTPRDTQFLQHALRLGARHLGHTWPNPSVGCILVRNDHVIGTGITAPGGRPHAETNALNGIDARGATAYVTLEPCAHHGATPPCAQALIDAGVTRVVYACADADARVLGQGDAMLRAAGIDVECIPLTEARQQHRGFLRRTQHGLPYVGMKLATSLDARMRDAHGTSQWITGAQARAHGQALRATMDAVMTGIGTVLADNPQLTVRLPGMEHPHLVRVVCDRQLQLPLASKLAQSAQQQPVWVITTPEGVERAASHATDLREQGVVLHVLEDTKPRAVLETLGKAGLTRVLVEAGPTLSTAFLEAACVDTLHWYRAPILLGHGGTPAVDTLQVELQHAVPARAHAQFSLGADRCEVYELAACLPD